MKILYLINYAGGGGTEKYVLDLLDGFTAAGEKCYLAYNIPGLLSEQAAKRKISSFQFEMKNSYDVKAAKTLARICSQNKIDIVHAQHTRELYVACLSKLFGNKAKVVFTNHLLSECGKARKLTNSVLARPLCSKFITVCEKGRELMDKNGFGTSKTVTIFNGINTKRKDSYNNVREQLGIADDVFVITALTRYSPEKGVGFLIDSINELKNDPGYLNNLASLPEAEKQALLYGSWDSFSGQVFTEWRNDPAHYEDQRWTHVIKPFRIPAHWKIWRGYDFGYSRPFSVGWYAADEDGRLYRIKELYGCAGTPNEGLKIDPVEQARRIREAEENDPMLKGRVIQGVADPAIFNESQGESIAQMQEKHPYYLVWHPGDHTRLAGKMQMHYRLAFNAEGRPMLQVFDTCKHFIRTIPNLVYDESNVEDIDSDQEDHIYDECRYVLMENPLSPRQIQKETALRDDPLDLDSHKSRTRVMRV